jgi:hypothetical protein
MKPSFPVAEPEAQRDRRGTTPFALLEKERIIDVIRLVSVVDPAPGRKLTRHANALEVTPIMSAVLSKGAS